MMRCYCKILEAINKKSITPSSFRLAKIQFYESFIHDYGINKHVKRTVIEEIVCFVYWRWFTVRWLKTT